MNRFVAILALVLAGAAALPAGARADFGIEDFDVGFAEADGSPAFHAGSHPFTATISLELNADGDEAEGRLRDLLLDLVPGLVANATFPRCATADFVIDECSLMTVVGSADSSFGVPDQSETAPIVNLVPPHGTLLRLGLRLGGENVFLDVGPSLDPPHNLIAEASDIPEVIELFGVDLQLWGEPSNSVHDVARGGPVAAQTAFLTSPRSCEGPLSSFAEVVSWDDEADFDESITRDAAGDPLGFGGCGDLGFQPLASAQLTTEAAQTPTGFNLSIAFDDEGLLAPGGIADSDLRELALVLPEGMAADSALREGTGACSEADFGEEATDNAPNTGCPATSQVGTAAVESPLLGDSVEGFVYRAVPFANAADAPMAVYVVFRDVELGILVKQAVGLEADPETDQLIAFAEEIPQLPFERLQLHLAADGGALVSSPRCGDYKTVAEMVPWSDNALITIHSAFEIVSGPNGGPCPVHGGNALSDGAGQIHPPPTSAPPASGAPTAGPSPRRKRPCPKGKHRVRRNGKVRCIKHRHKKTKAGRRRGGDHKR